MSIQERISKQLSKRAAQGNLRYLKPDRQGVDFFSNDYLGLAQLPEVAAIVAERYGALEKPRLGATGSRLLSGNSALAMQLEQKLARIFEGEAALLFNSGYVANMALIAALAQKGDLILYDELVHASLREGYRLSFADRKAFLHNNLADLEQKLVHAQQTHASGCVFVITESVYSMDGDNAVLAEIVALCKHYGAYLLIDEAHSTGIFGTGGNGMVCELQLQQHFLARVYTFGKAIGAHGACVVGPQWLIDYLVNFGRPFIYSTAMPDHTLVSIDTAFDYIAQHPECNERLRWIVNCYLREARNLQLPEDISLICNQSPIQALVVPGNERCKALAAHLMANGCIVLPILAPTVPAGVERLRICLHAFNTEVEIVHLIAQISRFFG
ncbi:aminotransferase class I/II-fold pyridoxal phosphate-dependent enzyme [Rhodoflexus sp.]